MPDRTAGVARSAGVLVVGEGIGKGAAVVAGVRVGRSRPLAVQGWRFAPVTHLIVCRYRARAIMEMRV